MFAVSRFAPRASSSPFLTGKRKVEAERIASITSSRESNGCPLSQYPSWSSHNIPASRTARITTLALDLGLKNRIIEANPMPKKTWEKPWMLWISVLSRTPSSPAASLSRMVTATYESAPIAGYHRCCFTSREPSSVSPADCNLSGDDAFTISHSQPMLSLQFIFT